MGNVLPFRSQQPTSSLRLREIAQDGIGELSKWFAANKGARAKFRIRVQHLQKIHRADWNKKQFRGLGGGLFEIKWSNRDRIEFRAIGFDREDSFVMLVGCTHKMNIYDPQNSLNTAKRLKKEVQDGYWRTVEFTP
jgi:phage-related protein